ncbi:MAG: hypothetical protein OXF79_22110 [Chloroflexi bacterium]|nr:hypothetical protein [Chloroflexota bacterium]
MAGSKRTYAGIAIIVVALLTIAAFALVAMVGLGGSPAQAHEDGTLHYHPTPTPPLVGLDEQVVLHPSAYYHEDDHILKITTVIEGAPLPEEWQYAESYVEVSIQDSGWSVLGTCDTYNSTSKSHYEDDVAVCDMTLPDYFALDNRTEPLVTRIQVNVTFWSIGRSQHLSPSSTFYIDLYNRANWK